MKYLIFTISMLALISCNNKAEVPATVQVNTAPVTGEVIVKHVITMELPTVFTDTCRAKYNDRDYTNAEERAVLYNKCVADYINELIKIINGITPPQLPPVTP